MDVVVLAWRLEYEWRVELSTRNVPEACINVVQVILLTSLVLTMQ